jgi:DNA-binding CsgD family transcriptional regulator
MATDEEQGDEHFRRAVALAPTDVPFELARTRFCWGERLRRRRDPGGARPLLREAVASFDHLGARTWAQRARAELRAAGERPARDAPAPIGTLTAQELRCALAVADGLSNREVAASLFLSQKTVEYHLNKAYAKLGVHSRTQLARAVREH